MELDAKKDNLPVKLIIDTDPGVDDIMALGIALTWPTAEVLAFTCVQGNVDVDQCCINASRVLDAFGRKDVPLYKGAGKPLIGDQINAIHWHGKDGILDSTDYCEQPLVQLQENHAVLAIIELAKKYKNEITLCAIGPLTNLALAVKLMPELPSYLKEVIIIGGNYAAVGNQTATAEFNFYSDPAAAHIVLKEYICPVTIIPWETLKENMGLSNTFVKQYSSYDNPKSKLFGKIMQAYIRKHWHDHSSESVDLAVDSVAIAISLNKEVITEQCEVYAVVEETGKYTRGMMVVDWNGQMGKNPNITLVKAIDKNILHEMLMYSVK